MSKKYSQEYIADCCGVSRQAVSKWECGSSVPDLEKLVTIARLFHVSVDALLTGSAAVPRRTGSAVEKNDYAENERIINRALKLSMPYDDPDEGIRRFISFIGEKIGCDRMYIFEINPNRSFKNTYEWCGKNISSQIEYLQSIPLEDMSPWLKAFSNEDYVIIEDIEEIAEAEPGIYRWLKPQGIRSLLVYPLFGGRGFIGVDNPAGAFIRQTSSLMGIIVHFAETMLQRRDLMRELKWANQQNDRIIRISKGVGYHINLVTGKLRYDREKARELGYEFNIGTLGQLEELASSHPEFRDHLMLDGLRKVLETRENTGVEFISYRNSGEIRWNRLTISPFMDAGGNVLQLHGMLQDISERHAVIEQYNKYVSHLSGGLHVCRLSRPIQLEYASDDLCAFLGYGREEFERHVSGKYTNLIVEEDRALFRSYVGRLAANPGIESCMYGMMRKDGSVVQVVDTMESVADGSGTVYGYSYILEKSMIQAMLKMAEENERRQLSVISMNYEILESLARDYLNVFRVWLNGDKAQIIKLNGYVTGGMDRESSEYIPYYRFCMRYIEDRVHPEDRSKMLAAMHPDTVRRAFSHDSEYIVVYRVLENGEVRFYQLKYILLSGSGQEEDISFVAAFKNIDKVIEEERMQKIELKNRLDMINAILQAFACGYYVDLVQGTFKELSTGSGRIASVIGREGNIEGLAERVKPLVADRDALERILGFLNTETLDERIAGQKILSSQVYVRDIGWYAMHIFVVGRGGEGKVSAFIFAAEDITEEKEKEEEYLRSLALAGSREKAALQHAYRDSLTGVMNRNAFERDVRGIGVFSSVGFIFCDVNGLKKLNDSLGHGSGDVLLQELSALLKRHFSIDCIYRIGGDEFVCMIGNIDRTKFTERVREFTEALSEKGGIAAIGSSYGDPGRKDELIREAELAMYAMKGGSGRSGCPADEGRASPEACCSERSNRPSKL